MESRNMVLKGSSGETDIENRLMETGGEESVGLNGKSSVDT